MAALKERLRAFLGLDTKEFERGLNKSQAQVKSFSERASQSLGGLMSKASGLGTAFLGGIAGGIVGGAITGLTSNLNGMVKSVAAIGDEAKRAGMGLQAFQEWRYVAEQTRVGVDQIVDGFKELSMRGDEFVTTGGGAAADAFQRLGYSAADLKTKLKDPSALMLEITDRMKGLDAAARLRVADEIFGGAMAEQFGQLLDRGSEGLRGLIGEAHSAGAVLDAELVRRAEEVDARFSAMTQRVGNWAKGLAVVLADLPWRAFETRLNDLFPDEAQGRAVLGDTIYNELDRLRVLTAEQEAATEGLIGAHQRMGEEGRMAANAILMSLNEIPSSLAEQRIGLGEIAENMRTAAGEFDAGKITAAEFAEQMGISAGEAKRLFDELAADEGITLSTAISAVGRLAEKIAEAVGLARSLKAALPGGVAKEVPGYLDNAEGPGWQDDASVPEVRPKPAPNDFFWEPATGGGGGGKGGGGKGGSDGWERSLERIRNQTLALEAEAAAIVAATAGNRQYGDALEYARVRADLLFAAKQANKEVTPELQAEIDKLAQSYVTAGLNAEEAADRLREVEESGERGANALSNIFTSVMDGSRSAKEAVAALLMEMAKVQMQKAVLGLMDSGAGGGIFSFIGGLLGGKRATGGPVAAGVPYLVNENTPRSEIFVPGTGGAVLTVAQAQGALSRAVSGEGNATAMTGGGPHPPQINIHIDASGAVEGTPELIRREIMAAIPGIMAGAVQATANAQDRGALKRRF